MKPHDEALDAIIKDRDLTVALLRRIATIPPTGPDNDCPHCGQCYRNMHDAMEVLAKLNTKPAACSNPA